MATKERPILFSGEMVRAILAGRKTQTRRVVKVTVAGHVKEPCGHRRWHPGDPDAVQACPYGQPGDRLWVRETWGEVVPESCDESVTITTKRAEDGTDRAVVYAATGDLHEWEITDGDEYDKRGRRRSCWRSPIHMPRWASRINLVVKSRRIERLQEISGDDAIAEGVVPEDRHYDEYDIDGDGEQWPVCDKCGDEGSVYADEDACDWVNEAHVLVECPHCPTNKWRREQEVARYAFRDVWDSINAKRGYGWNTNHRVWVIEFERIDERPTGAAAEALRAADDEDGAP